MGGLHAKSMTSQRKRAAPNMADMRYYGNVITTRWRLCVTMATLWQDGGYALLWQRYDNKMAAMRYYGNVMTTTRWRLCVTMETLWRHALLVAYIYNKLSIHIQQHKYSHVIDVVYIFNSTVVDWTCCCFLFSLFGHHNSQCTSPSLLSHLTME
jgi:hypothetical protein